MKWTQQHLIDILVHLRHRGISTRMSEVFFKRVAENQIDKLGWLWFSLMGQKTRAPKEYEDRLREWCRTHPTSKAWNRYVSWARSQGVPKSVADELVRDRRWTR